MKKYFLDNIGNRLVLDNNIRFVLYVDRGRNNRWITGFAGSFSIDPAAFGCGPVDLK